MGVAVSSSVEGVTAVLSSSASPLSSEAAVGSLLEARVDYAVRPAWAPRLGCNLKALSPREGVAYGGASVSAYPESVNQSQGGLRQPRLCTS